MRTTNKDATRRDARRSAGAALLPGAALLTRVALTGGVALTGAALLTGVALTGAALLYPAEAQAQEIQLTGPLAGAPAVRQLRLHREARFDIAAHATFTLLDEFRRGVMPGLRLNYHIFDWLGVGVFGGPFLTYNTAISDELQDKAVNQRNCDDNPNSLACRRSAVSLCRDGEDCLADSQLGRFVWYAAPQITIVPFRGKFSLLGEAFVDADISIFAGPAFVGVNERADCERGDCSAADAFALEHKVRIGPTFGFGFNFYPLDYLGFGAEFRATPFVWNTSGFDTGCDEGADDPNAAALCTNGDLPDDAIDGEDRALRFNPMLSVYVSFQLPMEVEVSD